MVANEECNGWPDNVWAPSPIPFDPNYPQPKELTKEGIKRVVQAFADAAKRAIKVRARASNLALSPYSLHL